MTAGLAHYAEAGSLPRFRDEEQRIEREEAQARKVLAAGLSRSIK
jgi:hypothetical protein